MSIEKQKNIMVYVETVEGSPINVSLEALTQARKLATGDQVVAVLVGEKLDEAAKKCVEFGADEVLCIEDTRKEVEAVGDILAQCNAKYEPKVILIGSSLDGKDIAAMVASRAKLPSLTDVIAMREENGTCYMTIPMYSGNILKEVSVAVGRTVIVVLRSGACKKEAAAGAGNIQKEAVVLNELLTKVTNVVTEISESVNLEEAEVIVSGGRGMGSKENFELVKQLAEVCGGVVGATRPVTEENWVPRSHQIGQSGKIVAPKLYIACGISGATQHISGAIGSNYIVAINKDEDASIFDVSDVGIVGNVMDILPLMIEEIKKVKSK